MIRRRIAWVASLTLFSALLSAPAVAGSLSGTSALAPAQVDLTSEGTADWAHWGHTSATDFDQKATGGGQISNFTALGGANPARGANQESGHNWTDGSPTGSATNSTTAVRVFSEDRGFSFTAPADTSARTLVVYVGARFAEGELTATLSDGSALPYTVSLDSLAGKDSYSVTIDYTADSAGQSLTVDYVLKVEATGQSGWAALESAALQGGGGGAGALSATAVVAPSVVDLTQEGQDDWAHWALDSATSFDQKAGVTSQISDYQPVNGATPIRATNLVARYSWSDGTPTASASQTRSGLKIFSEAKGYSFTVSADTTPRILDVYVGINRGVGELTATLSDGSASPVSIEVSEPSGKASYQIRLDYVAASPGQVLTIEYLLKSETNAASAWASLESATVVGGGGNAAPTITSISDQSIVEGDSLAVAISASDSDGPAPITLSATTTLPGDPNVLTDNGDGTGSIDWLSASGDAAGAPYSITVRATDAAGAFSEESFVVDVTPTGGSGGSIVGSQQSAPGTVDLTAAGQDDWIHWALNSATEFDRKANVTPQLSDYALLNGATASRATNIVSGYSWSDGTPTSSATDSSTGLKVFSLDKGFTFSAPAGTATRTLRVYVGVNRGTGQLTATLSDGSAAAYTTDLVNVNGKSSFVVTLTYAADSDGEQLDVDYVLTVKDNPSSAWISLESAALVGAAPGNAAPLLDAISDQAIAEGDALQLAVLATDADGPAPIVLTETNTLPGNPSILTDNNDGTATIDWSSSIGDAAGSPYTVTVRAEDGLGAFSEETFSVSVLADGGGTLAGGAVAAPATVSLSSIGTLDWAHWGLNTSASLDRRDGGGELISDYTALGGANPARGANQSSAYSWTDGTPTTSVTNSSTGLKVFSEGRGFSFTVPADTTPKTLYAYVGARNATGQVTATLSDGSAAAFSTQVVAGNSKATFLVTINYVAASAGQTLTVEYLLTEESNPSNGWASLESAALADGTALELPYAEDFSAGAPNWMVLDDTTTSSSWQATGGAYVQSNAVGFTANAMSGAGHVGTYSYLANGNELTDYTLSVTVTPTADSGQDVGIMARVNPATGDYLRLSFSGANSFGRLEVANGGVFASRASDSRGALPGVPVDLELHVIGPVVMAYRDGTLLYGAYEESVTAGTVGLYCRDACEFDDVLVDTAPASPAIAIASPVAYSVSPGATLAVSAVVVNAPAGATVSFDVPGESSPCGSATEVAPGHFTASCTLTGDGLYTLEAELRDASATLLDDDVRTNVGVGYNYAAIGDSITAGLDDPTAADGQSNNGFVVGIQGYEATLMNRLEAAGQVATVTNSGTPGDKSVDLAQDRITGILQRHPDASHMLMTIGVNDAGGASFTDSGLGCSGATCEGTFAGYVQDVVDAASADGKTVVLAQTPPRFGDPLQVPHPTPETHPQNLLIEGEYNQVILNEIANVVPGPDFYEFFLGEENRFYLYETNLHPNALGYHAMAVLFDQVLSGSTEEPFFASNLCQRDTLGGACVAPLAYKQNLMEPGSTLYVDASDVLSSAPAVLDDGRWIQTADADRNLSHADYLEFDLPGVADVYVAYDDAASTIPAWLSAYTATADTVTTSSAAAPVLRLYRLDGASGTLTLGGADASVTGAAANYLVIIVD